MVDCFLPCNDLAETTKAVECLRKSKCINNINLLTPTKACGGGMPLGCNALRLANIVSSEAISEIARTAEAEYVLLNLKATPVEFGDHAIERMLSIANETGAGMVYSDRISTTDGKKSRHQTIDYQEGSLRDDFDFGQIVLLRSDLVKQYADMHRSANYSWAGFYDLRLFVSRKSSIFHINETLYTEVETDKRLSGEKQFDYVDPKNREVQIEMEKAVTDHLREIGALAEASNRSVPNFDEPKFECEASVVIPVFNRERTIADAVMSALKQKTSFRFNVIVVDNHSTDSTTEILRGLAKSHSRLVHIIPQRRDLGIGGCWNTAIDDKSCGRFAVQLDSDDLYSSDTTLATIVKAFRQQKAAMVVGSYRMCDFELNTLPPGIISHSEWTDQNGANNALRINGLGAPRAFFTPLAREIRFPNTSYGEDYAVGLAFSRRFKIGRIYDELYLCRRWTGNSDAALSNEKVNENNLYKDKLRTIEIEARKRLNSKGGRDDSSDGLEQFFKRQLESWPDTRERYRQLANVQTKELDCGQNTIKTQFNPARIVSTGASIDKKTISKRPCFLCKANRPAEQMSKSIGSHFELLVNPYPILPMHFTVPSKAHEPQSIRQHFGEIYNVLDLFPQLMVFYNGPKCGASAPDHLHLQAGTSGVLPLQAGWKRISGNAETIVQLEDKACIEAIKGWITPVFAIRCSSKKDGTELFGMLYDSLEVPEGDYEPMMNIVAWKDNNEYVAAILPRRKHRPDCYYAEDAAQHTVSPGAIDMSGLIITPRKEDFDSIDAATAKSILEECGMAKEGMDALISAIKEKEIIYYTSSPSMKEGAPEVCVGIVSGKKISFSLNNTYMAKGQEIKGAQTVEFCEGGILWNGTQYRELTFTPKEAKASFSLNDVTIGVDFHWQRKETQTFVGTLHFVIEADKVCAINELPVERYLESVISSEMSATSSLELLKAHAVISRSWLLAQMVQRRGKKNAQAGFFSFVKKDDELIRWYDREDHTIFDVCADDHCQRYQGITKATSKHVAEAVESTSGEILMYENQICDARFSKCCGGISEEFRYCWQDVEKPYLKAVRDDCSQGNAQTMPDLTIEENAEKWIMSKPEAFCNTSDKHIISQVLNSYDQETTDFYRWTVEYSQQELSQLIAEKLKADFGLITDLIPLERGKSGRISKLKIVGTKKTFTIGKELEIRRTLSNTHLYSSAFVACKEDVEEGIPQRFVLHGAGWGHGVGLCQIGAAVMGEKGYDYKQILHHYYKDAEIKKIY